MNIDDSENDQVNYHDLVCDCGFCVSKSISDSELLDYYLKKFNTTRERAGEVVYKSRLRKNKKYLVYDFYLSNPHVMDRNIRYQYDCFVNWNTTCIGVTFDEFETIHHSRCEHI